MNRPGSRTLERFYLSLHSSIIAGLPIRRALTLASLTPALQAAVRTVDTALDRGQTLAQAWRAAGCFAPLDCALIEAGERSGTLAAVFAALAETQARRDELRRWLVIGLIYPAVLLLAAIAAVHAPLLIQQGLTAFLQATLPLLLAAVGGCVVAAWLWGVLMRGVPLWAAFWYSVPVVGSFYRARARVRFLELLARTHAAGLSLRQFGEFLTGTADDALQQQATAQLCATLRTDVPLGEALAGSPLLPRDEALLLAGAETAGTLAATAERCAQQARSDLTGAARRLAVGIGLAITAVIGAYVTRLYVRTVLGYFDTIDRLL